MTDLTFHALIGGETTTAFFAGGERVHMELKGCCNVHVAFVMNAENARKLAAALMKAANSIEIEQKSPSPQRH